MDLLEEFKDGELSKNHKTRNASRAILFDEEHKIPILFVSKKNYHKLPGGGLEENEKKIAALKREVIEEVGSEIQVEGIIGEIVEYRKKHDLLQKNFCYYGSILSKGEPKFTEKEQEKGFTLLWLDIDTAIEKLENDKPESYTGEFIQKRDLRFLREAKKLMKH